MCGAAQRGRAGSTQGIDSTESVGPRFAFHWTRTSGYICIEQAEPGTAMRWLFVLTGILISCCAVVPSARAEQGPVNPQLALCDRYPKALGEAERWRMHQTLINSFPARYFDVLSSVTVEESSNDMLLGPIWRIPMDRKSAPTLVIPQGILAKQCRMLLFQIYHLSGYAGGRDIVKNAAVACIRRGGARSACLDSALVTYLSSVSPLPSAADAPFTLDQFLAEAPWSAV